MLIAYSYMRSYLQITSNLTEGIQMTLTDDLSSTGRSVLAELGTSLVTIGRDGRGSGIVIAAGKVLTNAHNLRDRTTLVTFADGRAEQGK